MFENSSFTVDNTSKTLVVKWCWFPLGLSTTIHFDDIEKIYLDDETWRWYDYKQWGISATKPQIWQCLNNKWYYDDNARMVVVKLKDKYFQIGFAAGDGGVEALRDAGLEILI